METSKVHEWVTSPYCFCKDLPWLALGGLPATPALLPGILDWEDMAILAAFLIALAFFLFLLFFLLCCLCPGGLCCGPSALCCSGAKKGKTVEKSTVQAVEMSSVSSGSDTMLTAVDLKLPRAWMDSSKSGFFENTEQSRGTGQFSRHKLWASTEDISRQNGRLAKPGGLQGHVEFSRAYYDDDWLYSKPSTSLARAGKYRARSASVGSEADLVRHAHLNSAYSASSRRILDGDWLQGVRSSGNQADGFRTDKPGSEGGFVREVAQNWDKKSRAEVRKAWESRHAIDGEHILTKGADTSGARVYDSGTSQHASHTETAQSRREQEKTSGHSTALVGGSLSTSASGSLVQHATHATSGSPVVQCYTVTKKTTTTTYGDEEGDEETCVVTTTEKKWREGMNEIGEICVSASASVGELLPSLGAPANVMADVSNVRTVKSLTDVEGSRSDVIRRYEYQHASVRDTAL